MSTTVVHALCARCGGDLVGARDACPACEGAVPDTVMPLITADSVVAATTPAGPARISTAIAISVLAVALPGVVVLGLPGLSGRDGGWMTAVTASIAVAVVQFAVWTRTGRAAGDLLTSTRTVSRADGSAPGLDLRDLVTVVRTPANDPMRLSARGIASLPPRMPAAAERRAARAIVLVFADTVRIPLMGSVVLGRNPPDGDGAVAVPLPDMSRSISKSHVRLDNDNGRVFAQDLGSTNGTELVGPAGVRQLAAGDRVEVPAGAHLRIAGITLRVDVATAGRPS